MLPLSATPLGKVAAFALIFHGGASSGTPTWCHPEPSAEPLVTSPAVACLSLSTSSSGKLFRPLTSLFMPKGTQGCLERPSQPCLRPTWSLVAGPKRGGLAMPRLQPCPPSSGPSAYKRLDLFSPQSLIFIKCPKNEFSFGRRAKKEIDRQDLQSSANPINTRKGRAFTFLELRPRRRSCQQSLVRW